MAQSTSIFGQRHQESLEADSPTNPMPDAQTEIEYKFVADHVSVPEFLRWAISKGPVTYDSSSCPDVYYVRGTDSIRHRWNSRAGELTVKQRRSKRSTFQRVEIDLHFDDHKTSVNDVTAFLVATGWKRLFTLFKDGVHCFEFSLPEGGKVFLSIYAVEKFNEKTRKNDMRRQFVEIEVEKGSKHDLATSRRILDAWKLELQNTFRLANPINVSLYEIYSGRRAKSAT